MAWLLNNLYQFTLAAQGRVDQLHSGTVSSPPTLPPILGSYSILLLLPSSFLLPLLLLLLLLLFLLQHQSPPAACLDVYLCISLDAYCMPRPLALLLFPSPLCKFTILFLLYGTSPFCYSFCLRPLTGRLLVGFITNGNYYWYKWCVTVRVYVCVCMCACVCVCDMKCAQLKQQARTCPTSWETIRKRQARNGKDLQMEERRKGTRLRHCRNVPKVCWCLDKRLSHVSSNHPTIHPTHTLSYTHSLAPSMRLAGSLVSLKFIKVA